MLLCCTLCACAAPLTDQHLFVVETADILLPKQKVSSRVLQTVNIKSHPDASSFKRHFIAAQGRTANFAGHYMLLFWGCGAGCQQFSIVGVNTGQIFMDDHWITSLGVCFQASSNLLVTNPGASQSVQVATGYYQWTKMQLKSVKQQLIPILENCNAGSQYSL